MVDFDGCTTSLHRARLSRWKSRWRFLPLAYGIFASTALAADKSGVTPNTISIPKGPGSVEGLGESFQPTLNTGTAHYGIALKTPPATAGHAPRLRLNYEGGMGNSPLGFGWQLPVPFVQRQTDKGIPTYGVSTGVHRPDCFINDAKEELVPQTNGYFFCKNEGAFVRYRDAGTYWEGTRPDGTRLEFGRSAGTRIEDAPTGRVFCWLLEKETDTHGNTITYSYTSAPGESNLRQKYLASISYGPGAPPWTSFHFVVFEYEDRLDWFEDCRPGFAVRTGRRLKTITVGTQGPALAGHLEGDFNHDGVSDHLNYRYDLGYLTYAGANTHWSLLGSVRLVGADGVTALPAATFGYAVCHPLDQLDASGHVIGGTNVPPFLFDTALVDLVDLNGDALPDILKTGGPSHQAYLNLGELGRGTNRVIGWSNPVEFAAEADDAWGFDLGSTSTHLADMDGDGQADLVHKAAPDSVFYFPNRGRAGWATRRPMSLEAFSPPAPFSDNHVRTADVDFDKRIDLIRGDGLEYHIWFNLGGDRYSDRITANPGAAFDFALAGVQIADLNGDRVPDVARVWPTSLEVTVGLGYGNFADPVSIPLNAEPLTDLQVAGARLVDVTGDGLVDLVIERAAPGTLWYWINYGNYSFALRKEISGLPAAIAPSAAVRWSDLNGNGSTDLVYADPLAEPRLQTVDIGELINGGLTPSTLVAISNGIGRVTEIGFSASTRFVLDDAAKGQPWPDALPFPVTVVSSVTNSDSLGHQYVTQFRYHDGYYDPEEKQFRGFARVEQIDIGDATAPTLVTRSHFDTGRAFEAMKGSLLRLTAETEDGRVFKDDFMAWQSPPRVLMTGTNGQPVSYAHPTGATNVIKELGQGTERRLESEMAYDNYGNQTLDAGYGIVENGNRSAFDDERIAVTQFAINTNAWILRTPARQEIRDETGAVISRTDYFYDDETFAGNNLGIVTIGNLTSKQEWISPSNSAATISAARTKYDSYGNPITLFDPLAPAPAGAVDFSKGHAREIAYDNRFHTYPVTETIHLGEGKEPLVFQAGYDEGFGTVTSSADFNSNQTLYGYDTFARLTSIVKPGDSFGYPTVEYDYNLAAPFASSGLINFIETRQLDKTPGTAGGRRDHYFISRQFVDGLGRKLLTKTEAEPAPDSTAARVVVTEAVQFNARQKPARVLNPHFSILSGTLDQLLAFENIESSGWQGQFHDEGSLVTLSLGAAHATRTEYDATLRELKVTNPDTTFSYRIYKPLLTESFDENDSDTNSSHYGTPMAHYQDGLGRLIRVDEISRLDDDGTSAGVLRTWTTSYGYDLNDQLTRIIDSQDNVKTFNYDGLKRKTFMSDPDRGHMTWIYDNAGNLREAIDAKSQRITCTYDGANRIRSEKYHDGLPPPPWRSLAPIGGQGQGEGATNSVIYHYDTPYPNLPQGDNTMATTRNVKGALAWVEDLSGEEHTSYDSRGRVESVVKRIPDLQFQSAISNSQFSIFNSLVSYKTAFAYDSLDRLTDLTYPDLDQLRYEYNDRNLLRRIPGGPSGSIISNLLYQPSAQSAQIDYGNGVRTTYTYDSRLRLKELLTARGASPQGDGELIHFFYTFDGVSNIKSIEDRRPSAAVPAGDPRRNTQLFQYDDLYRLTQVQYSFELPGQSKRNDGVLDYRYDRIGNMLAQTSTLDHKEKGLPVANLGQMDSGGSAGRWNRTGRASSDPPGPHALTSITQPSTLNSQPRLYSYDANGNMTNIDGLQCSWDFKDRLVRVEDTNMVAHYTYDYTDRRITKRVFWKQGEPVGTNQSSTLNPRPSTTTVCYINKYFEVREHDAPTKYVWNGNTRVARVTGSLNTNIRAQRLRIYLGWNLCSLAVSSPSALRGEGRGVVISAAFKWRPASQDWETVAAAETLPAGTVLWLQATTNATLTIIGTYNDPTNHTVTASGDFLPGASLEVWNIHSTLNPQRSTAVWAYDARTAHWVSWLPPPLEVPSDLAAFIAPGQAVFARADATVQLEVPESALRIRYYHQDHQGSSTTTSDAQGTAHNEMACYPFGRSRHTRGTKEQHAYIQKERDEESELNYVEARYLQTELARFLSVDQMLRESSTNVLTNPQALNCYSYAEGNPVVKMDISGRSTLSRVGALVKMLDTAAKGQMEDTVKQLASVAKAYLNDPRVVNYLQNLRQLPGSPGAIRANEGEIFRNIQERASIAKTAKYGAQALGAGLMLLDIADGVQLIGLGEYEKAAEKFSEVARIPGGEKMPSNIVGMLVNDEHYNKQAWAKGGESLTMAVTVGLPNTINLFVDLYYELSDQSSTPEDERFRMDPSVLFQ